MTVPVLLILILGAAALGACLTLISVRSSGRLDRLGISAEEQQAASDDKFRYGAEARRAQHGLARINRALRVLSASNSVVIRAGSEEQLLAGVCKIVGEIGGYRRVWIGLTEDDEGKSVRAVARFGDSDAVEPLRIAGADDVPGQGLTGTAIRTGTTQVNQISLADPAEAPNRPTAIGPGFWSSIALPLKLDGRVIGALTAYACEANAFDKAEVQLLEAMISDLGFGLSVLRARNGLKRADAEIQQFNATSEQRIRERTEQLEAANKDLEGFSYSVSHDLRAPLRAIDVFSSMLLEGYQDKLDAEGQRLLQTVHRNAGRMTQLIDDILAFSRVGRKGLSLATVDMNALVRDVLGELIPAAGDRKIDVRVAELPALKADPPMIRQVLVNLLANAIKFTSKREQAVIEISGAASDGGITYLIRDNGAGFDPAYSNKLFGVFQRLHGTDEFPGTGIGLAIVKRIIDKHGGRVWAESQPDQGASFQFSLPASRNDLVSGAVT